MRNSRIVLVFYAFVFTFAAQASENSTTAHPSGPFSIDIRFHEGEKTVTHHFDRRTRTLVTMASDHKGAKRHLMSMDDLKWLDEHLEPLMQSAKKEAKCASGQFVEFTARTSSDESTVTLCYDRKVKNPSLDKLLEVLALY